MFVLDWRRRTALFLLCSSMLGCGNFSADYGTSLGGPGDFGATVGGVKDLNFARERVAAGQVPPADAILVEAAFAEHDLPLPARTCEQSFCVNAAAGVAPTLDNERAAWVQIGLSSSIDPETFERAPIAAVMVVDVSGSMRWGSAGSPGELARKTLGELDERLDENDRVAIVSYGSDVSTVLEPTAGGDSNIDAAIAHLSENGSTNMEAGLERGYEIARSLLGEGRDVRLFLFTDENPNVGATEASDFEDMVEAGGAEDIGLTVFGLGPNLNPTNLAAMSHLRLANAYSAVSDEDVDSTFEDSWPWMTSVLATDLNLKLVTEGGLSIAETYGIPRGTEENEVEMSVGSVFLSKNRGAMLLRFELPETIDAQLGATISLSYNDANDARQVESMRVDVPAITTETVSTFDAPSVQFATALAILFSGLHDAVELRETAPAAAATLAASVIVRAEQDAVVLANSEFDAELTFARELVALF